MPCLIYKFFLIIHNAEILNNLASLYFNTNRQKESAKIYHQLLDEEPNKPELFFNFGQLFFIEKNYEESVKYFQKSIDANIRVADAWFNIASIYAVIGPINYEKTIYFFKNAVKGAIKEKNENLKTTSISMIYLYLGFDYWNKNDFVKSRNYFKSSLKMFKIIDDKFLLMILDSILVILEIDKEYIEAINSNNLLILKNRIISINNKIDNLLKDNKLILKDDLVYAKYLSIKILCSSMEFQKIPKHNFNKITKILTYYNFENAITSFNNLKYFINYIQKYNSIEEISISNEKILLNIIQGANYLDGYISRISFEGNINKNSEKQIKNIKPIFSKVIDEIEIGIIDIDESNNEWVTISSAQINFDIIPSFPFYVKNEYIDSIIEKIKKCINLSIKEKINIICFPELVINFEDITKREEIINYVKNNSKDMVVILGTYYNDKNENISPLIYNNEIYRFIKKMHPSLIEDSPTSKMATSKYPILFKTKYGLFSVLICKDIEFEPNNIIKFSLKRTLDVQLLFIPSYNPENKEYEKLCSYLSKNLNMYICLANRAKKEGKYGGSSIYALIHKNLIDDFEYQQYRQKDNADNLIIEIPEKEGIIYAELNIVKRTPPIPQTTYGSKSNIKRINRIEI